MIKEKIPRYLKIILLFAVTVSTLLLIFLPVGNEYIRIFTQIFLNINSEHDVPIWLYTLLYSPFIIFGITAGIFITKKVSRKQRDAYTIKHLQEALSSKNPLAPAATIEDLANRLVGPNANINDYQKAHDVICENIHPIQNFIQSPCEKNNTLIVEGGWGSGKTTSILVAADLLSDETDETYRFIYESAFKYNGSIKTFEKALIASIGEVLDSFKISGKTSFNGIVQNIEPSLSGTILSIAKSSRKTSSNILTTNHIGKINSLYKKKEKKSKSLKLVVIIDDLDRLQGQDMISVLSLLSIIRRFSFIKIILAIDSKSVVHQLSTIDIYRPELFVQKYLPEQHKIEIRTDYDIVRQIAFEKIAARLSHHQYNKKILGEITTQIYDAIMLRILSDRLNQCLGKLEITTLGPWFIDPSYAIDKLNSLPERCILNIPTQILNNARKSSDTITFHADGNRTIKLEDSLLQLVDSKTNKFLFKDVQAWEKHSIYDRYIKDWLSSFVEDNWGNLRITIREISIIINQLELESKSSFKILTFVDTYNKLFKHKITIETDD